MSMATPTIRPPAAAPLARTWMATYSGRRINLLAPDPRDVCLQDVAWHLSLINRFTGATRRPYSVAEHSLLVCHIVQRFFATADVHAAMAALLHDAHEAYTNDVSRPGKMAIGSQWHAFERRHQQAVHAHFAITAASARHALAIKAADDAALATEMQQLCAPGTLEAAVELDGLRAKPIDWIDLMDPGRVKWTPREWCEAFVAEVEGLEVGRCGSLTRDDTA